MRLFVCNDWPLFKPGNGPFLSRALHLDKRDGFTGQRRAEAYGLLSKLAGHATPEGFVMLTPQHGGSTVHCGPFYEATALHAVLSDAANIAQQAASAFRLLMRFCTLEQQEAAVEFMEVEADWREKFLGAAPDRAAISDLRAILTAARAEQDGGDTIR